MMKIIILMMTKGMDLLEEVQDLPLQWRAQDHHTWKCLNPFLNISL